MNPFLFTKTISVQKTVDAATILYHFLTEVCESQIMLGSLEDYVTYKEAPELEEFLWTFRQKGKIASGIGKLKSGREVSVDCEDGEIRFSVLREEDVWERDALIDRL